MGNRTHEDGRMGKGGNTDDTCREEEVGGKQVDKDRKAGTDGGSTCL